MRDIIKSLMGAAERLSEAIRFIVTKTPLTCAYIIHNPLEAKFEKTYKPFPKSIDIGNNKKLYPSDTSLTARVNGRLLKIDDGKAVDETDEFLETLVIFSEIHKALKEGGDSVTLGDTGVEVTRVSLTEKSSQDTLPLKKKLEKVKVIPPGLYVVGWSCDICGWKTPRNEGIIQKLKYISTGFPIPEGVRKTHAKQHKQDKDQYLTYSARPHRVGDDTLELDTSIKYTGKVKFN